MDWVVENTLRIMIVAFGFGVPCIFLALVLDRRLRRKHLAAFQCPACGIALANRPQVAVSRHPVCLDCGHRILRSMKLCYYTGFIPLVSVVVLPAYFVYALLELEPEIWQLLRGNLLKFLAWVVFVWVCLVFSLVYGRRRIVHVSGLVNAALAALEPAAQAHNNAPPPSSRGGANEC